MYWLQPCSKKADRISAGSLLGLMQQVTLVLLILGLPNLMQAVSAGVVSSDSVSQETLEVKIKQAEANTEMDEKARARLIELYRKSLTNLQTIAANRKAAEAFQKAAQSAQRKIEALRKEVERTGDPVANDPLNTGMSSPLATVERLLQKEKANFGAVDARRKDLEIRLEEEARRPVAIPQRLSEARQQQEEIDAQLKLPSSTDQDSATAEARQWELRTRYQALSTEITMLDQELLSQPMRIDLLEAEHDKTLTSLAWIGERVDHLEDLVTRKRQDDADLARAQAEQARQAAEGMHPAVVALAEKNAALSEERASMVSRLAQITDRLALAESLGSQIEEDFKSAQETIEIGGLSQELGHMLQQQRQSLPDLKSFQQQAKERVDKAARIGVLRLQLRKEQKHLRNLEKYVAGIVVDGADEEPVVREQLRDLARERRELIATAIESADFYLLKLSELESAQLRLLSAIEGYDTFLDEHLLWVRSASRTQLEELGALPEQVLQILSPTGWLEVMRVLAFQATHSPVYVLLALILGALLWARQRMIAMIRDIVAKRSKPTLDRFGYSIQALLLTLIVAASWPLVVVVTGWQLRVSAQATVFSIAVGSSLFALGKQLFFLRAFRMICMPEGLAASHFRWPDSSLRLLRSELDRLTWIYLPTMMVTLLTFYLDPLNLGWAIGRTAFVILVVALALAFYRLLHPRTGVLVDYMKQPDKRTFSRLYRIWYPLIVAVPLVYGLLFLMGYLYTAGILLRLLADTIWVFVGLLILHALAQRWLRVTQRRLVYEAAVERRLAEWQERHAEHKKMMDEEPVLTEVEEPEVDFVALSDTSRKLLSTAVVVSGLVSIWLIWSEVFPAFRIFDDFTLWQQTVSVDGESVTQPITLADFALALVYLVGTIVLAKQLPAVIEIVLLHRTDMLASDRYTVTTLASYIIVAVGIVLVFKTVGADWSKLQWLIAALGVGIGFGLQEIVANFISGIIILFERPVRVGDVVTVGDTDGVVTRIRIRATTIRNWDGKELLVPNKEFITGRLLNWSLSDTSVRILVSVGIAYGSNVRRAMNLLEEAAKENEHVMDDPAPSVIFESFGDNSLNVILRCFVENIDIRMPTISALNQSINSKLNDAGIVIAFPQRDLHLDTTNALRINIEDTRREQKPTGSSQD